MFQRKNAVVFLAPYIDACALWRLYMPHLAMPGSSFFCFTEKPHFDLVAGNDICVVQRCCLPAQIEFLKILSQLGIKVVYDLDDNVWQIPPSNPAHAILAQYKEGFGQCIQMADVVSVSTRQLAQAVRRHVQKQLVNLQTGKEIPVVVAENRMFKPIFAQPVPVYGKKTVGWAGSTSHIGDLPLIEDAVRTCSQEFEDVRFQFRGHPPGDGLQKLPNVEFIPWTPVSQFCARMPLWGWSVGLAPVTDEPFNACKSNIKMIESAWCGVPVLASHVYPYFQFCQHDPELEWLLCSTPAQFTKKLRELLGNDARRIELGARCRAVAERYYTFGGQHEGWEAVLEAARCGG